MRFLNCLMDTSKNPKTKREVFSGFHKTNPKSYESQMKQNNSMKLLGESFNHIYNKNGSTDPPPTQTPLPHSFKDFSDFT